MNEQSSGLRGFPDELLRALFDAVSEQAAAPGEALVRPLELDCSNPDSTHLRVEHAIGPRYTNIHALASTCRRFYEFYRTTYIETIDLRKNPNTAKPPKVHQNTMAELRQHMNAKDDEHATDFANLKRLLVRFPQASNVVLVFAGCYPESIWKELAESSNGRLRAIHLSNWCRTWARLFLPTWLDSGWLHNISSAGSGLHAITAEAALVTVGDLGSLAECSSLRALSLSGYFENEAPLRGPDDFAQNPPHPDPSDHPFFNALIAGIRNMPHLEYLRLSLSFHEIETISFDAVMAALPPGFQSLELEGRQFGITTDAMENLSKTGLHSLCIRENMAFRSWATFSAIASQLRVLELHSCLAAGEQSGIETLSQMRELRRFHFHNDPFLHHGVAPGYERGCPAADAVARVVFDLPRVRDVAIVGSNCTDDGVARAFAGGGAGGKIVSLSFALSLFVGDATLGAVGAAGRDLRRLDMCGTAASRERLQEFRIAGRPRLPVALLY